MTNLAKLLITRRKQRKLTQQELADMAGVSRSFIKAVEKGRTNIRLDLLLRVLDIFGIELGTTENV